MRTIAITAAALTALALAGCGTLDIGSFHYCAKGEACSSTSIPVKPAAPTPAASAPGAKVLHARV